MPAGFAFPLDSGRLSGRDLWVPLSLTPVEKQSEGSNFDYGVVARLKPGISPVQAQQDLDLVTASIDRQYPFMSRIGLHAYFRTLKDETVRDTRQLLGGSVERGGGNSADRLRESRQSFTGAGGWA
jgi:hypothetical protein